MEYDYGISRCYESFTLKLISGYRQVSAFRTKFVDMGFTPVALETDWFI